MSPKKVDDTPEVMIVNDSPGEECRIAILKNNHLEELYTERIASATNVGNIYKGRVVNIEPAIQAAFIDYGKGVNGFLHISDLHPKYFPGSEKTERVGRKTPRRHRPPIQNALKRGQEILVQVLKQGVGTKGPTLTSYLSIPGRLLVSMPGMDRVGVSRKVEDEDKRRKMRDILDTLDLPDGFGFILRTAGFDQTKTELKRDVAYLSRLWKAIEKRHESEPAPCELYTESDLLIRTVRDVLRPTIQSLIVDSESAVERVREFLRVVSPRSTPDVIHYTRNVPIFHAFDIERQIDLIHSREVPLPSGGRLVIDQTEALVAIDVNSGRSRSAKDSETNAFETNQEAADEICRQLRLRDLGGLIINDLIDMRSAKNRKTIEDKFTENLKRDRAKTTALRLTQFGILEMTRQRMRPSLRKSHFMACPHCNGHGEIKVPEHVAADATRHIGFLLQYNRIKRVELVCAPRVASILLSAKRRDLVKLEDSTKKRIDVRVSDSIAADRVDYYAYDERNSDVDATKLPALSPPSIDELKRESETQDGKEQPAPQPMRRGRRRKRSKPQETARDQQATPQDDQTQAGGKSRRSRRKRSRRQTQQQQQQEAQAESVRIHELAKELNVTSREVIEKCDPEPEIQDVSTHMSSVSTNEAEIIRSLFSNGSTGKSGRGRRRRRGRRKKSSSSTSQASTTASQSGTMTKTTESRGRSTQRGRKRGRRRSAKTATTSTSDMAQKSPTKKDAKTEDATAANAEQSSADTSASTSKKSRRSLYRAGRTRVHASARESAEQYDN